MSTPEFVIYLHGFERHFLWNIHNYIDLFTPDYQRRIFREKSYWTLVDSSLSSIHNIYTTPAIFLMDTLLQSYIGSKGFIFTDNIHEANVLIESVFTHFSVIFHKPWKFTILFSNKSFMFTPEKIINSLSKYTAIISSFQFGNPKCIDLPPFIPYLYNLSKSSKLHQLIERPVVSVVPPKFCCCVVSNGSFHCRNRIFRELSKYKHVDSLGNFQRNVEERFTDPISSEAYFYKLSQYKFILCFECEVEGFYITEKLVNAWISRSIPIYFGASNSRTMFNPESYLYLEKDNTTEYDNLVRRIVYLDKHNARYLEMVNKPVFKDFESLISNFGIDTIASRINDIIKPNNSKFAGETTGETTEGRSVEKSKFAGETTGETTEGRSVGKSKFAGETTEGRSVGK